MQAPQFSPAPAKVARWRATPPALFPPILGLFGLAVGWVRTTDAFAMPAGIGQILMGAVVMLYLFMLGHYLAKVSARPAVVVEDMKVLPGRAGLAAMSMSGMLAAVGLLPYSPVLAQAVVFIALAAHALFLVLFLRGFLTGPAEGRLVTPVFHLTFVGFIVAPLALLPLGWMALSTAIFWLTFVAAAVIWGASLAQFIRKDVPAPLRPLLAIHVAPASLLGTVAMLLGMGNLGFALGLFALVLVAVLLLRVQWLIESGFSPLWGAFTFPLAAFSSLMMILGSAGYGELFRILGGIGLIAATFFIPWVMWKVFQIWMKGMLAKKTNAAVA